MEASPAPASPSPDAPAPHGSARNTLERSLRLKDLVLIVIGTVIGSGIFIVPATVLQQTDGRVGLALAVWFLAGVLSLLGALTYGELGAAEPEAGGLYVYLRDAFGPLPAFLYGWTLFFVISSGSVATLAVAFTGYVQVLVPLGPVGARIVPVAMIATVAVVNVLGTRRGAALQNWTTLLKVGAILLMGVLLIALGSGDPGPAADAVPGTAPLLSLGVMASVGAAMIGVLWAYEGWQYATFSAGETVDPQRTFPRGIVGGTAALIGIYLLANVGYVAALGDAARDSTSIAADAVTAVLGPAAGALITVAILISMFSAANGLTLTAPRVYWAMSRDGVFFNALSRVDPRFGTPAIAIVSSSLWAMVLAATGTFEQLLTYVVFVGWIFYALGALSIFVYRRRRPDRPTPFRVPGYPWTPALFVLAASAIVVNTLGTQPREAFLGLAAVALGTPAYYAWRAKTRREGTPGGPGPAG
ncbi:MAG TPA: amino acid permease [Longimicrobiales bacterium]|nr:amino acid permease [Longimicrobiales bacterium]